mmetsp:Transcript_121223/g.343032  ORF Transcript_121223/g.343032 Transcript_121223/m.343032 type:complete len:503 (+) Transcript_121223:154-1662(+)
MSDDESGNSRKRVETVLPRAQKVGEQPVARGGEPTQRFSELQQQLLCAAIHFFHRHIRNDADVRQRMEGNQMFRLFFEVEYHKNKPDLNKIFPDSVHDCSPLHVCSFILSILHQGIFSVSAFIVSVIYLSRFKESSHITLHACTWRPLFLTSLLLADKMWEDKPVRNSSLAKLFPVLTNTELNRMESEFLVEIRFNVLVKPDLFCSFCEKLLAEQVHQEITSCVNGHEYTQTLQADNAEAMPPVKPSAAVKAAPEAAESENAYHCSNDKDHQDEPGRYDNQRFDPVQAVPWAADATRPQSAANTAAAGGAVAAAPALATAASAAYVDGVPRSQSAGPPTGPGSRRSNDQTHGHAQAQAHSHAAHAHGARLGAEPRAQQLHSLMSIRGGACAAGGSANAGGLGVGAGGGGAAVTHAMASKSTSAAPQPARSVSVHPLHRNESTKKTANGEGRRHRRKGWCPTWPPSPPARCAAPPRPSSSPPSSSPAAAPQPPWSANAAFFAR